jgi:hypothetical protein
MAGNQGYLTEQNRVGSLAIGQKTAEKNCSRMFQRELFGGEDIFFT